MNKDSAVDLVDATSISKRLAALGDKRTADILKGFFKTGVGQYGEGDQFRGIRVPVLRKMTKEYKGISLDEIKSVLKSAWHEDRLFALLLMVDRFRGTHSSKEKEAVYLSYINNTQYVNNWDLVDLTAPYISGPYLFNRKRSVLFSMSDSDNMWERRIALLSTFYFIRQGDFRGTINLAKKYLLDKEDLIQKANGWMLREVGKRSNETLERFLKEYYIQIPRTTLRYAIEKYAPHKRKALLRGEFT